MTCKGNTKKGKHLVSLTTIFYFALNSLHTKKKILQGTKSNADPKYENDHRLRRFFLNSEFHEWLRIAICFICSL